MDVFAYERLSVPAAAVSALRDDPHAVLLAGGTELVNWLKDGIVRPARVLDINGLPGLDTIEVEATCLRIGALVRMSDLAAHPEVRRDYPAIPEALLRSASQQLRNMASMGGNLLQRTRCPYFRAEIELPCNKRAPGSGCSALDGEERSMAIFGWSEHCAATHPSDVAVVLAALDAEVTLQGPDGFRSVPVTSFYRLPGAEPQRDTVKKRTELITGITVPASAVARAIVVFEGPGAHVVRVRAGVGRGRRGARRQRHDPRGAHRAGRRRPRPLAVAGGGAITSLTCALTTEMG